MGNSKITALPSVSSLEPEDLFPLADVSEPNMAVRTKKATLAQLLAYMEANLKKRTTVWFPPNDDYAGMHSNPTYNYSGHLLLLDSEKTIIVTNRLLEGAVIKAIHIYGTSTTVGTITVTIHLKEAGVTVASALVTFVIAGPVNIFTFATTYFSSLYPIVAGEVYTLALSSDNAADYKVHNIGLELEY